MALVLKTSNVNSVRRFESYCIRFVKVCSLTSIQKLFESPISDYAKQGSIPCLVVVAQKQQNQKFILRMTNFWLN